MTVHYALTGVSTCGKSVALKEIIIPGHRSRGRDVIVLDPLGSAWPHATRVTTDPFQFVECLKRSWNCIGVVDEIRVFYDDFKARVGIEWCFFAGRNRGHLMYAAAQRMMMIPPNIREQCGNALLFRQNRRGLKTIADDMDQPDAVLAQKLPRGQCLICKSMEEPLWYEVFTGGGPSFKLTRRTLGVASAGRLVACRGGIMQSPNVNRLAGPARLSRPVARLTQGEQPHGHPPRTIP